MVDRDDKFFALIQGVRDGSEDAFVELVTTYGDLVFQAVRRRLSRAIRSKFDSTDFVQAVWATFYQHRQDVGRFQTPRDLVQYLACLARNKVIDECRRRLKSKQRNVNREVSLASSDVQPLPACAPTASELAIANERWSAIVKGLPSNHLRVAQLKRLGVTREEIARQLGVSEKTVQRILQRLKRRVEP